MMASIMPSGGRSRLVTALTSKVVRPMEDSTKFRKNAASVIRMIMPVVRSVASKARPSISHVSTRL